MKGAIIYFTKEQYEWADQKFEHILYNYDMLQIKCIKLIKTKHNIRAMFENGDSWEMFSFNESVRGKKVNISYVPHDTKPEILNIIKAMTVALPFNGIVFY